MSDAGAEHAPMETARFAAPAGPVGLHTLALLCVEPFRAAMELAGHKFARSGTEKPGDGHAVVIFPGLGGDGSSVATLREHCCSLGYDALDWGQGFNTGPHGDLDAWLRTLALQVVDLLAGRTQPATLIGWRLGGLYAREIGKLMAPRVRQVITIATPFNAQADHTNVGWLFRLLGGSSPAMDPALSLRLRNEAETSLSQDVLVNLGAGANARSSLSSISPR